MTTITTATIAVLGTLVTVILGYLGWKRTFRKDAEACGTKDGMVLTEIGYVKAGIDDIKKRQEKQGDQHIEVITRITAAESSVKQAHHRIDAIEKRIE